MVKMFVRLKLNGVVLRTGNKEL
ncbi:hypothetical protein BDFB_004452 [Asbolus verrucosus]|uniref:Uncharacterized protein n=1 Tax=Asbolus verrucosus TaxID=1661398 RepID=A0A482VRU7_ASBVE|nr:hypothetical protein BDFB_004452 [Asbolus verrucosus]